ncbi:MAG TPA: sigma-70 family RNA polymerase sigma factor [Blastocatellia bacterium]|nr:sigma-70 family RNA polymerase sigma factor [Blastocatellia bacterium]
MDEHEHLAERFEENRSHLRAVAYRMLGSLSEAEDAVQEGWLRLSRSDMSDVANLRGWLTTVVARVCLDMLRSRKSRREESFEAHESEPIVNREHGSDPEQEALLADSVGLALLVVLETLTPAERIAFVLHDTFDLPFDEIGHIVGRSPAAARQLASRARRRVRGAPSASVSDLTGQRQVVNAFLAALRGGDLAGLVAVLDPGVLVRADSVAAPPTGMEIRGAETWAKGAIAFSRVAQLQFAQLALVDGAVGLVLAPGGRLFKALSFTITGGKIVQVNVVADPERLRQLDLAVLDN